MMEINDKLKEVIDKCQDNYCHIKEIHYLILNKKYSSVTKKLISKYKITQDEAKILVNYYKEKAKQKYLIIEITLNF